MKIERAFVPAIIAVLLASTAARAAFPTDVTLVVDWQTGEVNLTPNGNQTITEYDVSSPGGQVMTAYWSPLLHQFVGQWMHAEYTDSSWIEEETGLYGPFTFSSPIDLGPIFNHPDGIRDLAFHWKDASNNVYTPAVSYVPEPAALSLLALGGLTLIRRRRA
jgi:hypothetical protein